LAQKKALSSLSSERLSHLSDLQKKTKATFEDLTLLNQAFCHRSFANETGFRQEDNERLEFLGDSVLGLLVVEHLYLSWPKGNEGNLANRKSKIVSAPALAKLARSYEFGKYLLMGKGESGNAESNINVLADTFEAFLGAYYLDQKEFGLSKCREFLKPHLEELSKSILDFEDTKDFKTVLQEYCQKKWKTLPDYILLKEEGSDHDKIFTMQASHGNYFSQIGSGKNKKAAEQAAAKRALAELGLV
jgi:ribonuclease III